MLRRSVVCQCQQGKRLGTSPSHQNISQSIPQGMILLLQNVRHKIWAGCILNLCAKECSHQFPHIAIAFLTAQRCSLTAASFVCCGCDILLCLIGQTRTYAVVRLLKELSSLVASLDITRAVPLTCTLCQLQEGDSKQLQLNLASHRGSRHVKQLRLAAPTPCLCSRDPKRSAVGWKWVGGAIQHQASHCSPTVRVPVLHMQ